MRIKFNHVLLRWPNIMHPRLEGVRASEVEVWGYPESHLPPGEVDEFCCDGYEGWDHIGSGAVVHLVP